MSRYQDPVLRSILSRDLSDNRLEEFQNKFAPWAFEILLEPEDHTSVYKLPLKDIVSHLHGKIFSRLEHFLWLHVPSDIVWMLRHKNHYLEDLRSFGIKRIWPNLPLFPQIVSEHHYSAPNIHGALNTIDFPNPEERDGAGICWALIDTDVRNTHQHFSTLSVDRYRVTGGELDLVSPADFFQSNSGHGTHIAGIIHSVAPGAKLVSLALATSQRDVGDPRSLFASSTGHLEAALQWLSQPTQHYINGVNISMGIHANVQDPLAGIGPGCKGLNTCVAAGKVVVVAAGNYGEQDNTFREISITDPANAHRALVVGACATDDPLTHGVMSYSSHGPTPDGRIKPDIVAPGEEIESCGYLDDYSSRVDSGTSQAAAIVSGACAVLLSRSRVPLSPEDLIARLKDTAKDLGGRLPTYQGAGVIQVNAAIKSLDQQPEIQASVESQKTRTAHSDFFSQIAKTLIRR